MTNSILEVRNLKKSYDGNQVIKGIDFQLESGEILGFVGPNGSGKTTTLKAILGLVRKNDGEVLVCQKNTDDCYEEAMKEVGAMIEVPRFYPHLSGYNNLKLSARMYKDVTSEEVKKLVSLVSMEKRIHDRVRKYSLGMKQRLGICQSLLGNPKLLLLDEPINGLDIDGVFEFRNILLRLREERGTSILISSHILSEVEKICDKVIVINDGNIVNNLDLKNKLTTVQLLLKTENMDDLRRELSSCKDIILVRDADFIEVQMNEQDKYMLINHLIQRGIIFQSIEEVDTSLENEYVKVAGCRRN